MDIILKNVRFVKPPEGGGDMEDIRPLTTEEAQIFMKLLDSDDKVDILGEFTENHTDGEGCTVLWDTRYVEVSEQRR